MQRPLQFALILLLGLCTAARASRLPSVHIPAHASGTTRAPGYLGIGFHDLTEDQAAALHLKNTHGVEIVMVDHDGPAGKAGLRPNDIMLGLNGQPILNAETLRRTSTTPAPASRSRSPCCAMASPCWSTLCWLTAKPWSATLSPRSPRLTRRQPKTFPARASPPTSPPAPPPIRRRSRTAQRELHRLHAAHGALHRRRPRGDGAPTPPLLRRPAGCRPARPDGHAQQPRRGAGLRAGDVVLRANNLPLRSITDWTRRLHAAHGDTLTLTMLRDKHESPSPSRPTPASTPRSSGRASPPPSSLRAWLP